MSRRIRKYPLETEPVQTLRLPAYPRQILLVQWHRGEPCLFVMGETEDMTDVEIRCYRTGEQVDDVFLEYLGSAMDPHRQTVWHYFEKR